MKRMTEEEIVRLFLEQAISGGQICVHYQPQYNHSTGRIVGAEGLMRWNHPEYGMMYPADFIAVMEKHGLIHRADLYVFEQICRFQNSCPPSVRIPISFNVSRHDLFDHDYVNELEMIRQKYNVPVKYLRAEITESSAIGGMELVATAIRQFHEAGYLVAMDDFGSGYSSLSILKNLPVDILKFDLHFLSGEGIGGRGGIILNSAIQMAKWLETQTIAEGVETIEQADFLKSVGCNYVQGYLYSKPIPEGEMFKLLTSTDSEKTVPTLTFIRGLKAERFWDPNSLETMIFNSFIGAAAIFSYEDGNVELLRVNEKYVKELGMNLTEKEVLKSNPLETLDPVNRKIYLSAIRKAVRSCGEETCETWRTIQSGCCGEDKICIRSHIRVIGKAAEQAIIYTIVQNITREKRQYEELASSERRFRFASEQANVYAWEYIVDTKEMRPCFRCMRDLGLPPLVRNYPEPAIKAGIFPPDYADMYRDWHKQIAAGVKELEAIIPLTVGRVPFHVRYTTEFDENGKPLKAYGSATLVVEEKTRDQDK
jgi:EAL domain-containing protein (putative c-di-GMP-specific phosphodiesterase class I)